MRRRTVLASVATLPAVAGCLGDGSDDGAGANDGATSGEQSMDDGDSASGDGPSNGEGSTPAALQSVANLPTLGEPIEEADRVVVAFEDPACPTCKSFHESDLPAVRSELIEDGYASLVWRPFRFVSEHYPWNAPAILAGLIALTGATGLAAVPLQAALVALPLDGLELSLFALVLSLYWLAEGMRGGEIRGCPVDPERR